MADVRLYIIARLEREVKDLEQQIAHLKMRLESASGEESRFILRCMDDLCARGDWPTFYVYRKLAYNWLFYPNANWFETHQSAEHHVNYQHSQTVADMMTSAFILCLAATCKFPTSPTSLPCPSKAACSIVCRKP
jgi:hypothetical protein